MSARRIRLGVAVLLVAPALFAVTSLSSSLPSAAGATVASWTTVPTPNPPASQSNEFVSVS
ncbi:MAG: hypothetical protein M0Z95_14120, partial [Actinomycetota bacterium]|nr:hypothetical protein [Actinomycetota bacterium]